MSCFSQTSSHQLFMGKYDNVVEVRSGGVQTIIIRDLIVPASDIEDDTVFFFL